MPFSWSRSAAAKVGDTGRIHGVLQWWLFCCWGAGSFNYGLELLHLEQNLRYEWTPQLTQAFFDNWLLNTKGKPDAFVPADLVQEFVNFWIKVIYAAKGSSACWDFIMHISPCIDVLRHVVQSVETEFRMPKRSGKHKSPEFMNDLNRLRTILEEGQVHNFKAGRLSRMVDVVDVFSTGISIVQATKLSEFRDRLGRHTTDLDMAHREADDEIALFPPSRHPGFEDGSNIDVNSLDMLDDFSNCIPEGEDVEAENDFDDVFTF
ncbi:hypothetical protein BS47DRAFT_1391897 [Hydnum rufescens UP504]|uniref:DUF6589 domain-containing protein n=1 Tax=Hydnum rufescens UP504 TaxID=1448309 RepID=A0A9P6DY04_9AGAM|nr:hypothetical protein BS47DRAFT_1391897 [Hydnum rufescens UP504]